MSQILPQLLPETQEQTPTALHRSGAVGKGTTEDFAAWERLLISEEDLADTPPIPLEAMRREALYGDTF